MSLEETTRDWTAPRVGVRLVEAFRAVARMPCRIGPRGTFSPWPEFKRDRDELLAAQESADAEKRKRRPEVRFTPRQVSQMEAAISWPALYLANDPLLSQTVQRIAFFLAMGKDVNYAAERLRISRPVADYLYQLGLERIAEGLQGHREPVF